MPLVRIDMGAGKPPAYRRAIGDAVHRALVETVGVPPADRFQVITEHGPDGLIYDPTYLEVERTDDVLLIQITFNAGRSVEQKKALYARIAGLLGESPGLRPADVFVSLVESTRADWSFGEGIAQ
jgi:phenylpyruvate tautomerase PptA (4-oxalocrotonate tautomerase family)